MNRSYFSSSIIDFLALDKEQILGALTSSEHVFDITPKVIFAWQNEIDLMKKVLSNYSGFIHFEWVIPRMGKRVDVLLVIKNIIFIIEFKVGSDSYDISSVTQTTDYALDMKNFHEGTHQRIVCPVLVATEAIEKSCELQISEDGIFETLLSNGNNLSQIITQVIQFCRSDSNNIDHEKWANSLYKPTPNIIQAAQALYEGHSVEDISRNDAGAKNLSVTSDEIASIILKAKNNNKKVICFVTGVPGSGKTLAGLDIATDKSKSIGVGKETVFLSGNGPLVKVLQEALARNKVSNAKARGGKYHLSDARREVKKFIQNIHHFRDENLRSNDAPYEKVVIFDESQRAWDKQQLKRKMNEKGYQIEVSEPDLLISVMDRHQDWCVIVCLVGGGQEINKGEAGISTWIESIDKTYKDWEVYLSDQIKNEEYSWGYSFEKVLKSERTTLSDDLHLSVSLRSFRSEKLSNFMNKVIAGDHLGARLLKENISDYPVLVTRSLVSAKKWLRASAKGSERYGMVAESNAIRLKPEGVFVKSEIDPVNWFLADKDDVRSSFYLEDVATEYAVQGLELDWVCLCWDACLRRVEDDWGLYKFKGSKFQRRQQIHERKYLLNAYRVLLTRARQGIVVFVPEGSNDDLTRDPGFFDDTYEYLLKCGFVSLD